MLLPFREHLDFGPTPYDQLQTKEGIPIVRSTPTGISAVVDARGHILNSIGHHRAGYIDTALPPALPPTLFSRLGNLAPFAFMAVLILLAIATRRTTR